VCGVFLILELTSLSTSSRKVYLRYTYAYAYLDNFGRVQSIKYLISFLDPIKPLIQSQGGTQKDIYRGEDRTVFQPKHLVLLTLHPPLCLSIDHHLSTSPYPHWLWLRPSAISSRGKLPDPTKLTSSQTCFHHHRFAHSAAFPF
jgi:hypothetical protein